MSKELAVIPIPEQSARAERINDYHAGCLKAFGQQMGYAFLCGFELNRAKEELPHGSFIKWREANLPQLANGTAANYMRFCDALQVKFPTVGNFKPEQLQLVNGELPKAQREEVLKAVHEVADGKSLTQLYRDLGVIRKPAPAGGFRPDAKALEKWLKEHHPDLAGTKFNDLAPAIQKAFQKQYRPDIDPELSAQADRDAWADTRDFLARQLESKNWVKVFHADNPEHATFIQALKEIMADHCRDFRAFLKGQKKKRRRPAGKGKARAK